MKRGLWLIFAALVLIAAAVLLRDPPESLAQAAPATEAPLPDVRVQHEYVTVVAAAGNTVNTSERNRLVRTQAMPGSGSGIRALDAEIIDPGTAPASRSRTVTRAAREQTFFEKARRAFIGDGRHRPEPFPRPRDNNPRHP